MRRFLSLLLIAIIAAAPAHAGSRIKDIAEVEGVRDNLLVGYGLVVGLDGSGDSLRNAPFTRQSLESMLERLGVNTRDAQLNTDNVAAVMVTANLPAFAAQGTHDTLAGLPTPALEAIHRIRHHASRLHEGWYQTLLRQGLSEGQYVELIGVMATVLAVDEFRRAMGMTVAPLPQATAGLPTRRRPAGAARDLAWVPTLAPDDVGPDDPDLYAGLGGVNIHRALSLVPEEVMGFFDLDTAQYLPDAVLRDFGNEYRSLSHAQIELLAARVSALNQCVY